jgi:hypothetical protein
MILNSQPATTEMPNLSCVTVCNTLVFPGEEFFALPNTLGGGPLLVTCPQLLIQYIHSYCPYLEAFSSTQNLRMCHAMVTKGQLNLGSSHLHTLFL